MPSRILVVEDEPAIARYVARLVSGQGDVPDVAHTLFSARQKLPAADILILDLGLPDGDGLEILKGLRPDIPVLVLSARDHERDKIEALDLGADDYLTKPFSPGELQARLRVAKRHLDREKETGSLLSSGDLVLDGDAREVRLQNVPVHLSPLEYRLLKTLLENKGKVLTTGQLNHTLYGDGRTDSTALRQVMRGLRKKIETDTIHPVYLHTETGTGYRLADL